MWCRRLLVLLIVMLFPFYVEIQYGAILIALLLLIAMLLEVMTQVITLVSNIGQLAECMLGLAN